MFNILSNHFGEVIFISFAKSHDLTEPGKVFCSKNTSHVESISSKTQEWETEFQSSSISQVVWVFASFCWVDLPGQGWNINQHTNDQKTHPWEVSIFYHLKMFKWSCEKYSLAADDTVRKMTPVAKGLPNQSVKNQDVKVRTMYYFGNMKQFFKAA